MAGLKKARRVAAKAKAAKKQKTPQQYQTLVMEPARPAESSAVDPFAFLTTTRDMGSKS